MGKHLIFYDGECGLCDRVVDFVLNHDSEKIFDLAPLEGITAKTQLKNIPKEFKNSDSLVLIENYHSSTPEFYLFGKGALRICWLLGGVWKLPGLGFWFPSFLYNWIYRFVAKNRHRLFNNNSCVLPSKENSTRFLP